MVSVGLALLTANDRDLGVAPATVLAALLLFNFCFTVNRVRSAARIVGYIQVALEGKHPWKGWETSMHLYRHRWKSAPNKTEFAAARSATSVPTPQALTSYCPTYWLHVALMPVCLVAGLVVAIDQHDGGGLDARGWANMTSLALLVGIFVFFGVYSFLNWPGRTSLLIEVNRARWEDVLAAPKAPRGSPAKSPGTRKPSP